MPVMLGEVWTNESWVFCGRWRVILLSRDWSGVCSTTEAPEGEGQHHCLESDAGRKRKPVEVREEGGHITYSDPICTKWIALPITHEQHAHMLLSSHVQGYKIKLWPCLRFVFTDHQLSHWLLVTRPILTVRPKCSHTPNSDKTLRIPR